MKDAMWTIEPNGLITHEGTGLQFRQSRSLWRIMPTSRSGKRVALDKRNAYLLELECSLWAYGRIITKRISEAA